MDLLAPLPDDILLILLGLAKDSRELGLTCTRLHRLYASTSDAVVFSKWYTHGACVMAPQKLYMLFTPAALYRAGNLPCLMEYWRRSVHIKHHFLIATFTEDEEKPKLHKNCGAAMAEWIWKTFADNLIGVDNDCPYLDSIVGAEHIQLLEKIYNVTSEHTVYAEIVNKITNFAVFKLVYEHLPDDERDEVCAQIDGKTPTSIITYLSIRGEELVGCFPSLFASSIEYVRALRLDDVLGNYDKLYIAANPCVREWLDFVKKRHD